MLSEEQRLARDTMRAFAQEKLAPSAARWDGESHFPREELKALGELGAMDMVVPERWGGAAMDNELAVVAYSPLAQRLLCRQPVLKEIGDKYHKTAAQIALRWLVQQERVGAIPKAVTIIHLIRNLDIL